VNTALQYPEDLLATGQYHRFTAQRRKITCFYLEFIATLIQRSWRLGLHFVLSTTTQKPKNKAVQVASANGIRSKAFLQWARLPKFEKKQPDAAPVLLTALLPSVKRTVTKLRSASPTYNAFHSITIPL